MPTGEYKLARQIGGRGHYARVKVDVTPGPPGIVVADSVFAWLKDEYGPEAWEWRDCDDMREGARAGAAYALQNRVAQGPLAQVVVAEIHASPVDTSKADVAFATCFAVWNALSDHGEAQPTLDQDWSSPFLAKSFSHPARVLCHLNGGFTKIAVYAPPTADGEPIGDWDIRTTLIPPELRVIGSRFRVSGHYPNPLSTAEEIRAVLEAWQVLPERTDPPW